MTLLPIHHILPELQCLLMSGHTAAVTLHHGVLAEGTSIRTLFPSKELAAKVRERLDGGKKR